MRVLYLFQWFLLCEWFQGNKNQYNCYNCFQPFKYTKIKLALNWFYVHIQAFNILTGIIVNIRNFYCVYKLNHFIVKISQCYTFPCLIFSLFHIFTFVWSKPVNYKYLSSIPTATSFEFGVSIINFLLFISLLFYVG